MLTLERVSAGYTSPVLSGVSARIAPGSFTALLGVNGSGKSTLLRTMAALLPPLSGEVLLDGVSVGRMPPEKRATRLSFLPQYRAVPPLTALQLTLCGRYPYLAFPRRFHAADVTLARAALERAGIAGLADEKLSRLSGGQRQKAYLAMLLAQDAEIVLLDEPTTFLDIACQLDVFALLKSLAKAGKTLVVATHDLRLALAHSDQILVLERGGLTGVLQPGRSEDLSILERAFDVRLFGTGDTLAIRAMNEQDPQVGEEI